MSASAGQRPRRPDQVLRWKRLEMTRRDVGPPSPCLEAGKVHHRVGEAHCLLRRLKSRCQPQAAQERIKLLWCSLSRTRAPDASKTSVVCAEHHRATLRVLTVMLEEEARSAKHKCRDTRSLLNITSQSMGKVRPIEQSSCPVQKVLASDTRNLSGGC